MFRFFYLHGNIGSKSNGSKYIYGGCDYIMVFVLNWHVALKGF
jgi:hypothetical protein